MRAAPMPLPLPHAVLGAGARRRGAVWALLVALLLLALTGCASLPAPAARPPSFAWAAPQATPLGQWAAARRAAAGARARDGFVLLGTSTRAFAARMTLIESARHTLDVQYYAIHADGSSHALLHALAQAAARGVRVRLLLDDFNAVGRNADVLRLAAVPGVELRLFNPLAGPRQSPGARVLGSIGNLNQLHRRMHNKLLLADSAVGITGGRNLGDAYFALSDESNFVDLDVLALGPVVGEMARSFDHYWNDRQAWPAAHLLAHERRSAAIEAVDSGDAPAPPRPVETAAAPAPAPAALLAARLDLRREPITWAPALLLADRPGKIDPEEGQEAADQTVVDSMLALMRSAQRDVLVVSPYFVPGRDIMAAFDAMHARGVRVRVFTNSLASTDAWAAHAGYARYRADLLRLGVELYELSADAAQGTDPVLGARRRWPWRRAAAGRTSASGAASRASLHAKLLIVDGHLNLIGSMNLDPRSHEHNTEVGLLINSTPLAREVTRRVDAALARYAWRVEAGADGRLRWRAPPGAAFGDADDEPGASPGLKLKLRLLGPLAPDELL